MFSDEILELILTDIDMREMPISCQSTAIRVIERVLDEAEQRRKDRENDAIHKS